MNRRQYRCWYVRTDYPGRVYGKSNAVLGRRASGCALSSLIPSAPYHRVILTDLPPTQKTIKTHHSLNWFGVRLSPITLSSKRFSG